MTWRKDEYCTDFIDLCSDVAAKLTLDDDNKMSRMYARHVLTDTDWKQHEKKVRDIINSFANRRLRPEKYIREADTLRREGAESGLSGINNPETYVKDAEEWLM